jgi:hypothetical protein
MNNDENDDLVLCFIKRIDEDENSFRFYFTNKEKITDVVGDNWNLLCNFTVKPPYKGYIEETYIAKSKKIEFDLLAESDFFTYNDGADNIIALCWELSENQTSYKKLVFHFGETLKDVEDKLFSREIIFKID